MTDDCVIPLVNWVFPILSFIAGAGFPPVLTQVHCFVDPRITVFGPVSVGMFGLTEKSNTLIGFDILINIIIVFVFQDTQVSEQNIYIQKCEILFSLQ